MARYNFIWREANTGERGVPSESSTRYVPGITPMIFPATQLRETHMTYRLIRRRMTRLLQPWEDYTVKALFYHHPQGKTRHLRGELRLLTFYLQIPDDR